MTTSALDAVPRARIETRRKNREVYDDTSSPVWRQGVYEGTHEGWEFLNMGGRRLLDRIARAARIGPQTSVLELGSGRGAACRYLAETYGCRATGVEINRNQHEMALAMRERVPEAPRGRLSFELGDMESYRTENRYQVVLSIDTLMLAADPEAVLDAAWRALLPGGRLEIVVIAAGEAATDRMLRYAWETDGMASLLPARRYLELLAEAGFSNVRSEDLTGVAVEFSERLAGVLAGLDRRRDGDEAVDDVAGWLEVGSVYEAAFRDEELAYLWLRGLRARD